MASEIIERDQAAVEEVQEEEEEEGEDQIEIWDDWQQSDEEDSSPDYLCLFCDSRFDSTDNLFDHCKSGHSFDFRGIIRDARLDFYGSFKLINYIRSQVAENKCWSCGVSFQGKTDLLNHLNASESYEKDGKFLWEDDLYLKPFMVDDALLYGFLNDEVEEDDVPFANQEELVRDLMESEDFGNLVEIYNDLPSDMNIANSEFGALKVGNKEPCWEKLKNHCEKTMANGTITEEGVSSIHKKQKDKQLRVSFSNVSSREIKNANDSYFGSYGSFGIHREMISDKIRTDAYRGAILNNPSLMSQATVMDVGCGTGILSLFAAQAGAARIIAIEASVKMAAVATQVAKDNGLLLEECQKGQGNRVITVVQCMVEELDKITQVPPHTVDVLVSEWMGYCLLYESMLSSVIYARDRWLKPGGAILPDTATIFVAGFGKSGTSLPFWENVYGFDMSCIGKEVVEDAAHAPIVDIMDSRDIVTGSAVLKCFDLAAMKPEEMDFTSYCELELKSDLLEDSTDVKSGMTWCYGIVLWFETGFTSRFCKEMPVVLSTSPYSPSTHWSQTIFTFQEPIAMTSSRSVGDLAASVGTEGCPTVRIRSHISIARSFIFCGACSAVAATPEARQIETLWLMEAWIVDSLFFVGFGQLKFFDRGRLIVVARQVFEEMLGKACVLWNVMKLGYNSCEYVESSLVDFGGRCGILDDARKMFDEMLKKNAVTGNWMLVHLIQKKVVLEDTHTRTVRSCFDLLVGIFLQQQVLMLQLLYGNMLVLISNVLLL